VIDSQGVLGALCIQIRIGISQRMSSHSEARDPFRSSSPWSKTDISTTVHPRKDPDMLCSGLPFLEDAPFQIHNNPRYKKVGVRYAKFRLRNALHD
jgi:hypothetical protein